MKTTHLVTPSDALKNASTSALIAILKERSQYPNERICEHDLKSLLTAYRNFEDKWLESEYLQPKTA